MTDRLEWQFYLTDNSKMVLNFNLLHLKQCDSYFQTFIQYQKKKNCGSVNVPLLLTDEVYEMTKRNVMKLNTVVSNSLQTEKQKVKTSPMPSYSMASRT